MAIRGFGAEFTRQLRMGWMSRGTQDAVVRLSQADTLRAVVIAGIGIAALDAAVTYDAAKAKGVDGALRSFAQSPFGPWLLILVALGPIAFGIPSFLEAQWRRTFGEVPCLNTVYSSSGRAECARVRLVARERSLPRWRAGACHGPDAGCRVPGAGHIRSRRRMR
jgi:hypothetical protein